MTPPTKATVEELLRDTVAAVAPSGDHVLLHVPSGTYLKLDQTAFDIVDLLHKHKDVRCAAEDLAARFSIAVDRAEADVTDVVDTLRSLRPLRASRARQPTLRGAIHVAKRWWALPLALQWAVAKAVVVVVAVEAGLRTTDIGRLSCWMSVPLNSGMANVPADARDDLQRLSLRQKRSYWAAGWVLDQWVFPGTCLRRALVVGYFLRRLHPTLRLGLLGDGNTAHAWVEAEGMSFNATDVAGTFSRLQAHRDTHS